MGKDVILLNQKLQVQHRPNTFINLSFSKIKIGEALLDLAEINLLNAPTFRPIFTNYQHQANMTTQ